MALARRASGPVAELRAVLSQVHPVFMLPPVAGSLFGGVIGGRIDPAVWGLHATAIFFAVYTAHVKDGFVDFYVRGEDDDHLLTRRGCRILLVAASAGFAIALVALWVLVGPVAALITLPGWCIGYAHAPWLDMNPVGATLGYPAGIAIAILGGAYVQVSSFPGDAIGFAAVFLVVLAGIKVIDDAQDYDYDRGIAKRTVPVVLGPAPGRRVGFGLMGIGMALTVAFVAARLFPVISVLAVAVFGVVGALAWRAEPTLATMLLIRGAYLFLAVLLLAVEFFPARLGP